VEVFRFKICLSIEYEADYYPRSTEADITHALPPRLLYEYVVLCDSLEHSFIYMCVQNTTSHGSLYIDSEAIWL
jgi:hypothetical protein